MGEPWFVAGERSRFLYLPSQQVHGMQNVYPSSSVYVFSWPAESEAGPRGSALSSPNAHVPGSLLL